MRRYVHIFGLIVLALAAGGWGSVVAATLCPHANGKAFKPGVAESAGADEACHPVKPEPVVEQNCHDSRETQDGTTAGETKKPEPAASPVTKGNAPALELPQNVPCTHCIGRPEVPSSTTVARQQTEQKRGFEPAALQAAKPTGLAQSFIKPVLYRQGAPPGSSRPKHLLTGILLI